MLCNAGRHVEMPTVQTAETIRQASILFCDGVEKTRGIKKKHVTFLSPSLSYLSSLGFLQSDYPQEIQNIIL